MTTPKKTDIWSLFNKLASVVWNTQCTNTRAYEELNRLLPSNWDAHILRKDRYYPRRMLAHADVVLTRHLGMENPEGAYRFGGRSTPKNGGKKYAIIINSTDDSIDGAYIGRGMYSFNREDALKFDNERGARDWARENVPDRMMPDLEILDLSDIS